MAGKVNTKFVYILLAVLVLLLGGAFAFYQVYVVKSAGEYEALGDRHLALAENRTMTEPEGEAAEEDRKQQAHDYRLAAQNFGKAFNKDRRNVDVLLKYIEALRQIPVKDDREAREIVSTVYQRLRDATEIDRDNTELLERFYQTLYGWGQETGDGGTFNDIYQLSSQRLDSDPDNIIARKWRGITETMQLSPDRPVERQEQALADLQAALEVRPDDPDLLHYLARYKLYQAEQARRAGGASDATELLDGAVELSRRAFETHPNDGQAAIDHVSILLASGVERTEEARPVIDGLAAYLSENPDPPMLVRRVVELLPRLDRQRPDDARPDANVTVGIRRAETLLRSAIAAEPDSLLYRVMLGNLLKLQLELDQAHDAYVAARDQEVFGTAEKSLREEQLRQQAVYEVANLELIRAERATDPAERKRVLDNADAAVAALQTATGETGQVHLLRGKIALLRGNNQEAMIQIDRASDLFRDSDVETVLLSAHARQKNNQWGAATQRLQQALDLVRNNPKVELTGRIRLQLAQMLVRAGELAPARQQLEALLEAEPENPQARLVLAEWYAASGDADRGIEILQSLDPAENPAARRALTQMQLRAGNPDEARAMLEARFAEDPDDLWALQTLLGLPSDNRQKMAYLEQARGGGIDPRLIAVLERQVAGEQFLSYEQVVDDLASDEASPVELALSKAAFYLNNGQLDQARPFYEQARQLDPENLQVRLLDLDFALADERYDEAERLVNDLAKQDADSADGHLLRARLAQAQGNTRQAIAEFDQALKVRPVFDEGWRQYGDLLRGNGDLEPALTAYRTAIDQRPDNVRAWIGIAAIEDAQGNRGPALAAMRQAFRFAPNDPEIRERYLGYETRYGSPSRVVEVRQEVAQRNPGDTDNRLRLALTLAADDQTAEALKALDALEADQGPSLTLAGSRAQVLLAAGRADEGREALESFLKQQGDGATTEGQLALARYLMRAGQVDASYEAYRGAVEGEDPSDRFASREFADTLFDAGRTAEAIEIYRSLYETLPADQGREAVGQRLVEALLRDQKPDEAEAVLAKLPPSAVADSLAGVLAMQRGDTGRARERIDASLQKDDANAMSYLQRATLNANDPQRRAEAFSDLEEALSLRPGFVQALALKAQLLIADDRPVEAVTTLERLIEEMPGNSAARLQLANLYARTGTRDRLASLIVESRSMFPDEAAWLQLSSGLASERGDTAEAIAAMEQAVQAGPAPASVGRLAALYLQDGQADAAARLLTDHPEMLNALPVLQAMRGRALAASGQDESARNVFALAFERAAEPNVLDAVIAQVFEAYGPSQSIEMVESFDTPVESGYVDLILAGRLVNARQYDEARSRLDTLGGTTFGQEERVAGRIARLQALAAYQSGDFEAAAAAYRRLLKQNPDDLEVLNNLAYLLANDVDRPQEAVPLAERAAKLAPENAEVLDTLGWAYYRAGDSTRAQETLRRSVNLKPLPANTLHLGQVYLATDLQGRARESLQQTVELATAAEDTATLEKARQLLERLN